MSLTIQYNSLCFSSPGVEGNFKVSLKRTIRLPDNGHSHSLPPSYGNFEVRKVEDYASRLAPHIVEKGGVFCCMHPYEAMWISFEGRSWRPNAVMVASGMINALTGHRWTEQLEAYPQNYCVSGGGLKGRSQPWIDGWMTDPIRKDVRQFVGVELGRGETVEEQLTGKAEFGGLQIKVFEPIPGKYANHEPVYRSFYRERNTLSFSGESFIGESYTLSANVQSKGLTKGLTLSAAAAPSSMGLGAGAKIHQEIYVSDMDINDWNREGEKVFVHLLNPSAWEAVTGTKAPPSPITLEDMYSHGWRKEILISTYPHWFPVPVVVPVVVPMPIWTAPINGHSPLSPLANIEPVHPGTVKPGNW